MSRSLSWLLPATLLTTGCAQGEGTIAVTAYGESFIEDGIPAAAMDDGWAVDFDRFVVTFSGIQVAGERLADPGAIDLTLASGGGGHELGTVTAPEGDHTDASFTIGSVLIAGSATRGADAKTFEWQLDQPTSYTDCETTTVVTDGGRTTFQITVHADHLWYDSLVAEEPRLLFQALADTDADADGVITRAELAAADIGAYDPGSEGGVDNLWSWLVAQSRTVGHVDGEGHCHGVSSGT